MRLRSYWDALTVQSTGTSCSPGVTSHASAWQRSDPGARTRQTVSARAPIARTRATIAIALTAPSPLDGVGGRGGCPGRGRGVVGSGRGGLAVVIADKDALPRPDVRRWSAAGGAVAKRLGDRDRRVLAERRLEAVHGPVAREDQRVAGQRGRQHAAIAVRAQERHRVRRPEIHHPRSPPMLTGSTVVPELSAFLMNRSSVVPGTAISVRARSLSSSVGCPGSARHASVTILRSPAPRIHAVEGAGRAAGSRTRGAPRPGHPRAGRATRGRGRSRPAGASRRR